MVVGEIASRLADEIGISRQRFYEWRDFRPQGAADMLPPREKALTKLTAFPGQGRAARSVN
jgi:hypothetical protein